MRGKTMIAPVAWQEGDTSTIERSNDDRARWRSERGRYIDLFGIGQELVETRSANHPDRTFPSWFHGPDRNVNAAKVLPYKSKHSRNTARGTMAPCHDRGTHRTKGAPSWNSIEQ